MQAAADYQIFAHVQLNMQGPTQFLYFNLIFAHNAEA